MRSWQLVHLGRHRFPEELTDFELRHAFTLDADERAKICQTFRPRLRIGVALQLGFLRLSGTTLSSIEYVPAAALRHLASQFRLPAPDLATLRTLYRRKMTRLAHQHWTVKHTGFRELDECGEELLSAFVRDRTHATIAQPRLEQHARDWLYRNSYLIPSARRVGRLVRSVVRTVTTEDHAALLGAMSSTALQACLPRLLERRPGYTMSYLEWLRRPPGRRSLKTMRILMDKYTWLEAIVARRNPLPIPKERQRVYARRFRRRRSSDIPKLPPLRQELEAHSFATVTLGTLADDLLRLVEMRIAAIWNWAHRVAAEQVTPARSRTRGQILAELRRLVADASLDDATYRSRSATLLLPRTGDTAASRAADVREILSRNARRVRPVLHLLLKLNLQGDARHPVRETLDWLKFYHEEKVPWVFGDPPREWTGRWQPLIDGWDLDRGLRAYEAATLWGVRRALRNGSLWSPYGYEFSDPTQNLMPTALWQQQAAIYRARKELPSSPVAYTDKI